MCIISVIFAEQTREFAILHIVDNYSGERVCFVFS